jgi:hypothetical protein
MKKLMTVTATFEYVVVVDTDYEDTATDIAYQTMAEAFRDITNVNSVEVDVSEFNIKYLPPDWEKESLPYNGDGISVIESYL